MIIIYFVVWKYIIIMMWGGESYGGIKAIVFKYLKGAAYFSCFTLGMTRSCVLDYMSYCMLKDLDRVCFAPSW